MLVLVLELLNKLHLSQGQLDVEISDEHLTEASGIIDDHEILGSELGLTEVEMSDINQKHNSPELRRLATLRKWKQKVSWKATYLVLVKALLKKSRADFARDVCKLVAQSKYKLWIQTCSHNTVPIFTCECRSFP